MGFPEKYQPFSCAQYDGWYPILLQRYCIGYSNYREKIEIKQDNLEKITRFLCKIEGLFDSILTDRLRLCCADLTNAGMGEIDQSWHRQTNIYAALSTRDINLSVR